MEGQTEELDVFLTAQQNGRSLPVPNDFPLHKADLVIELMTYIKEVHPDPNFAANLEAELVKRQSLLISQASPTSEQQHLTQPEPGQADTKGLPTIQPLSDPAFLPE